MTKYKSQRILLLAYKDAPFSFRRRANTSIKQNQDLIVRASRWLNAHLRQVCHTKVRALVEKNLRL